MKLASIIVRILMGLMYLFASIVVLFNLVPQPAGLTGDVKLFNDGIRATGYLIQTIKIFELICAISFLTGWYVRLATVIIFPITLNILLYHLIMDMAGLPVAIFLMAGNLFLAYYYRESYKGVLVAK